MIDAKSIIKFHIGKANCGKYDLANYIGNNPSKYRPSSQNTTKSAKISSTVVKAYKVLAALTANKYDRVERIVGGGIGIATTEVKNKKKAAMNQMLCGEFHHESGATYMVLYSHSQNKLYFSRLAPSNGSSQPREIEAISVLDKGDSSSTSKQFTEYILATLWTIFCDEKNEFKPASASLLSDEDSILTRNQPLLTIENRTDLCSLLSDNLYYRMLESNTSVQNLPESLQHIPQGGSTNDATFNLCPMELLEKLRVTEVLCGNFSVLKSSEETQPKKSTDAQKNEASVRIAWFNDRKGRYILDKNRVLTSEEEALIPVFNENFKPNPTIARVAKIIHSASDIRDIEFSGPAGSGKSVGAKLLAYMLGVPYRVFTCSPGLDESDLFGHYCPSTAPSSSRNLSTATYQKCKDLEGDPLSLYNVARKILQFPDLNMLKKDHLFTYELITGERLKGNEKITPIDVMLKYFQLAAEERDKLVEEIRGKSSKSLVFVKSPIVMALEHGDVVEVQEQNALSPGTLLGFNDLRDRHSCGYQLPNGETLKRNPNAVMIMTSNVEYEGCRPMNSSVVSRSNLIISFPALTADEMAARAAVVTGYADHKMLKHMSEFIMEVRNAMTQRGINDASDIGMRELIDWCYASQAIGSVYHACIDTVINKASYLEENREVFLTLLDNNRFISLESDYDEEAF